MKESELILNADGSIYHLALRPDEIAPAIILVGDQNRVALVSRHFDRIEITRQHREFVTHTGWMGPKRVSVISTGIGTDNIDIAINEIDALVNVDFQNRQVKSELKSLDIFRIGTSGAVHPDVFLGDIVVSRLAIGTDALGQYYGQHQKPHALLPDWSYLTRAYDYDLMTFPGGYKNGVTLTCPGFYAAQGRTLRIRPDYIMPVNLLHQITLENYPVTNIEMESAGIYLLAEKFGHRAMSFNAILAHRLQGKFASDPAGDLEKLIQHVLQFILSIRS